MYDKDTWGLMSLQKEMNHWPNHIDENHNRTDAK